MKDPKTRGELICLIVGVLLLANVFYSHNGVSKLLDKYNLTPKPEHFTELYFVNYPDISPNDLLAGKTISFPFVIHNLEGGDMAYSYSLYFKPTEGDKKLLSSDNIIVENNASKTIESLYVINKNGESGTFFVSLDDLHQEIFFSIPNEE